MWNFSNIPACWCISTTWNKISCRSSIFKPDDFKRILDLRANLGEFLVGPAMISSQFSILTENGHLRTKHLLCFFHIIDKGLSIWKEKWLSVSVWISIFAGLLSISDLFLLSKEFWSCEELVSSNGSGTVFNNDCYLSKFRSIWSNSREALKFLATHCSKGFKALWCHSSSLSGSIINGCFILNCCCSNFWIFFRNSSFSSLLQSSIFSQKLSRFRIHFFCKIKFNSLAKASMST